MKRKQNLVFRAEKQQLPYYDRCHNWIGCEKIEIVEFNYDGKGNALVFMDGQLDYLSSDDLDFILFGGWYSLVKD